MEIGKPLICILVDVERGEYGSTSTTHIRNWRTTHHYPHPRENFRNIYDRTKTKSQNQHLVFFIKKQINIINQISWPSILSIMILLLILLELHWSFLVRDYHQWPMIFFVAQRLQIYRRCSCSFVPHVAKIKASCFPQLSQRLIKAKVL